MDNLIESLYKDLMEQVNRTFLTNGGQTVELDVVDFKVESTDFMPARIKIDAFIKKPQHINTRTLTFPDRPLLRPLLRDGWNYLAIKDVIFNPPATIVLWKDGSKTVVKCGENDTYSKEHGLAMCICKKALGNKGNYNNTFKKWIKED